MDNQVKHPRRDAQANRERILDVARSQFEAHGLAASMDKIAKEAGVGPGTLYRHFPNREALFGAILEGCAPNVATEGNALAQSADAAAALTQWLLIIAQWSTSFEGATTPMLEAITTNTGPLAATCSDLLTTLEVLLHNAQQAGVARPEVSARDLYAATLGLAWAADADSPIETLIDLLSTGWRQS
ncbi:TetR/AcrR family transcriptional regulator [Corynebacterium lizhenjunii]|uniref:TetR/AcrR family transcriptional regulator n=1 Tax=Corynebacterium lizhenjunii TaxID=2709394 RepID=A0A7T0PB36_9CORY|nr:TetR/AcrR family transcriptional regulator [Corynebacterium lizhenjunii]QPK79741.1 TetR/AcrR family transcriptional regulator [Corynebacterium lizhenjunii]